MKTIGLIGGMSWESTVTYYQVINKTIKEQFNLLRIVDNNYYPAFFEYNGYRYKIQINKVIED